uniref:hypothetical protein n=1 Tax=uncultured Erythrobacter sp. TaxID=263913 RepID=UPI002628DFEF|nr:hypothetical protein [uncultured Erythrobacter sp.]
MAFTTMKALFQNPKAALAYAGITLIGAAMFIGTEDDPGKLHQTVENYGDGASSSDRAAQRKFGDPMPDQTIGRQTKRSKPKAEDNPPATFATDDELLDDAQGFDPTPEVSRGTDPSSDGGDPFLSDQDDGDDDADFGGWASDTEGVTDDE